MHHNLMPIGATELMLTGKGTIYHLGIVPEHMAPLVFTVGDPDRVKEVSKYFDKITHQAQHREFITHTGFIGGKQVMCVSTGIGPDNVDIVVNELDALVNIDFRTRTIKEKKTTLSIVRLGTCGSLQKDIEVDSMVVSSHAIGMDNLLHYYKTTNNPDESFILHEFNKHAQLNSKNIVPYIAESAISLRKYFGAEFVHGITVTCPGFFAPQGRVLRAPLAFPHLINALVTFRYQDTRIANFEMETSALYGLGKVLGNKCLSVSTVVANRINDTYSKNSDNAVDKMIKKVLETLAL